MIDAVYGKHLSPEINTFWIQNFVNRFQIVSRAQMGNKIMNHKNENETDIYNACHLWNLSGLLEGRINDNYDIENADETNFVFNVDNGHTLKFFWNQIVKYTNIFDSAGGFKILDHVISGRHYRIEASYIVVDNRDRK